MLNEVHVPVTQEHIDRGVRAKYRLCPLALALQDAYKNKDAGLNCGGVYPHGFYSQRYLMASELYEMIREYDNEVIDLTPGTLVLEHGHSPFTARWVPSPFVERSTVPTTFPDEAEAEIA